MTQDHVDEQDLRASDAERSATADVIRRATMDLAGTGILEERLERCYRAKTRGELDALTADLPGPRARRHDRRRSHRLGVSLPLVAIALLVAVAITHGHMPWLIFPLVFFTFFRLRWRHAHARASSRRPH